VIIPRTVRLSEAPGFGQPITVYDARSKGAEAYRELAREVALRPPPETPMPSFDDLAAPVMAPVEEFMSSETVSENGAASGAEEGRLGIETDDVEVEGAPEPPEAVPEPEPRVEAAAAEPDPEVEAPTPPAVTPEAPQERPRSEASSWEESPPEPEPRVKPLSRPPPPGELPERRVVVIDEAADPDIESPGAQPTSPGDRLPEPDRLADIGEQLDEEKGRRRRWRMFRKGGE
jgi:hypothetical protein